MYFRRRNNRLLNELHEGQGLRRHHRHHLPDTAKNTQQNQNQSLFVEALNARLKGREEEFVTSLSAGFHSPEGGRRPTINNMAVREESERERESVACLSNLVQGAEINSMLFLPFLSLLTVGIQPSPLCAHST